MKRTKRTILALLIIFIGLMSCEKDKLPNNPIQVPNVETPNDSLDTPENCGCGDKDSIAEWSGVIYYQISAHPKDTSTHNKFWITSVSGSSIYIHHMVCNKNLPQEILKLKEDVDTTTKLNIIYSGDRKKACKIPENSFSLDNLHYDIVLTKIEVQ